MAAQWPPLPSPAPDPQGLELVVCPGAQPATRGDLTIAGHRESWGQGSETRVLSPDSGPCQSRSRPHHVGIPCSELPQLMSPGIGCLLAPQARLKGVCCLSGMGVGGRGMTRPKSQTCAPGAWGKVPGGTSQFLTIPGPGSKNMAILWGKEMKGVTPLRGSSGRDSQAGKPLILPMGACIGGKIRTLEPHPACPAPRSGSLS